MQNDLSPIVVTGEAGFIGSNFILEWLEFVGTPVVDLATDRLGDSCRSHRASAHQPAFHRPGCASS
jgi:dTDP-D-glucose 4,6-dehydratase